MRDAFAWIGRHCAEAPQRFAHRDFQSQNLLVRRAADGGVPRCMLIDLQGAFLAPPEYDLVCLLRDSYLALDEPLRRSASASASGPRCPMRRRAEEFALRFDLLTLTRKGKDHARFLDRARPRRHALPPLSSHARRIAARDAAARTRDVSAPLARLAELVSTLPEAPPCAP